MWTPRTPPVSARTLVSAASGRLVELRVQKIGEPMDLGSPEGDSGKGRQEFEVRGWMIKLWVGVRFLLREYARHTVHTLCTHTHKRTIAKMETRPLYARTRVFGRTPGGPPLLPGAQAQGGPHTEAATPSSWKPRVELVDKTWVDRFEYLCWVCSMTCKSQ